MAQYRKKPVVIDAEQYLPSKKQIPLGVILAGDTSLPYDARPPIWWADEQGHRYPARDGEDGFIATKESWIHVSPGDWVITGVKGEKYPCKPDIFEMTYEAV